MDSLVSEPYPFRRAGAVFKQTRCDVDVKLRVPVHVCQLMTVLNFLISAFFTGFKLHRFLLKHYQEIYAKNWEAFLVRTSVVNPNP
jgi:hypothetical protein